MKSSKRLLSTLLQALVDEWGHEEVAAALASTAVSSEPPAGTSLRDKPRKKLKLTAVEQIERAELDAAKKEAMLQIAERYDRKQFLPSVADVREFLIAMGERPPGMKDRKDAFRVLLQTLIQLPMDSLRRLSVTALHSGPSELGPLSEAIAAAGERLPRHPISNSD